VRRFLNFDCLGARLAATLDDAAGDAGLLIVSGGNEIRAGAHRGMARLAMDMAATGYPVFRFDRRGVGDSEGTNGGFEASGDDIAAAISAFRAACPALRRIIAFGNCDAATALLLHQPAGLDGLVLSNIWAIEATDDLPPPAAIKARYLERLKDPKAWRRLMTGAINLRKLASGLVKLVMRREASTLETRLANAMAQAPYPAHLLLARRDTTAIAFAAAWQGDAFAIARQSGLYEVTMLDSAAHSFASRADYAALKSTLLGSLGRA
jgi:exosortase A-associated hydrolase 1